jgi:hypothetical protein
MGAHLSIMSENTDTGTVREYYLPNEVSPGI